MSDEASVTSSPERAVSVDRRRLLSAMAMSTGAATASPSLACTFAIPGPEKQGQAIGVISRLFQAWWARQETAFLGALHGPRGGDQAPSDEISRRYIAAAGPAAAPHRKLFEDMFRDRERQRYLLSVTVIPQAAFVACHEASEQGSIGPDCSGTPNLHQFHLDLDGLNVRSIRLLSSAGYFGYAQVTHWSQDR